jgi:hypothetical protein
MVRPEPESSYEFVIAMNARKCRPVTFYRRPHRGRAALSNSHKLQSTGGTGADMGRGSTCCKTGARERPMRYDELYDHRDKPLPLGLLPAPIIRRRRLTRGISMSAKGKATMGAWRRYAAEGSDFFTPRRIDFFVAVPNREAREGVAARRAP